jgi:FkbM family methyltransferase
MPPSVIYDFGANNGDDLPYYLTKSDVVVAVEANPDLCEQINTRFHEAIRNGKLFVENCILDVSGDGDASFYIHKTNHVLSQFPKPDNMGEYREVRLPSRQPIGIIRQYGPPHFVKIDVEHYDQFVLRNLFDAGIRPPFISAEAHNAEVFSLLVALGNYNSFKLVDGNTVSIKYKNHLVHSAGPFGPDVEGDWMTADNFLVYLALEGLGWKDIHATNVVAPNPSAKPRLLTYIKRSIHRKALKALGISDKEAS